MLPKEKKLVPTKRPTTIENKNLVFNFQKLFPFIYSIAISPLNSSTKLPTKLPPSLKFINTRE
jgi:hypothetical protein